MKDNTLESNLDVSPKFGWRGRFLEGWAIFKQSLLGKIGLVLLTLFALMAICSFIPPLVDPMYNPMTGVDPEISFSIGPSWRHWLGTDFMGRDIFSQLLAGTRVHDGGPQELHRFHESLERA